MDKVAVDNGERWLRYSEKWWRYTNFFLVRYQVDIATPNRPHVRKVSPFKQPAVQLFKATTADSFVNNVQQQMKQEFKNNSPIN